MAIETKRTNSHQRDVILNTEEGHFSDLKAIEIAPGKLTRTIAAFANADGGELYVGIAEDKQNNTRYWRGFPRIEDANGHIQAFEPLFPLGNDFEYCFLTTDGESGFVLQIQVQKTADIKKASDGLIYLRRGAQSLPVSTPEAVKRLEYTKGISSFEAEPIDAEVELLSESIHTAAFMRDIVPAADPLTWLKKQRLIKNEKPVVAGVLLFAEDPQALIPKHCGVKIYRYKTRDAVGTRESLAFTPRTVEGNIYSQILSAVETATAVIEEIKKLGDASLENIQYPTEAIHEIVTNAILHRDYSAKDDIHIRIFDNRIEVESPGRLPAHITVENILNERYSRNGSLVRLINKFPDPPNKDVGEGLNTAFAAMQKLGLKPPVISERANSVMVAIRHEALASPETLILEYLETNPTIRNKTARELCHISADYIVKDIFGRLVDRELIERVPGTDRGSTAYQKGPKFSNWRSGQVNVDSD